jgi:hypothetical protein
VSINLIVNPTVSPMGWREFNNTVNNHSIALDGYVASATKLNNKKKIANFNHHEDCNRYASRATCDQIRLAIHSGLFDFFRDENGEVKMDIYVNDCDEDVCLSVFLLKYGYISGNIMNPALNTLVNVENELDTTAGAYPYPKDYPLLRKLAWVFAPYKIARSNGLLRTKDKNVYEGVITDVCNRIMEYLNGNSQELALDTRYEVLERYPDWSYVKEIGIDSRTGMFGDGIKAFVSLLAERENGNRDYVIGKMSPFVDFDLLKCLKALNDAEGEESDLWGGSNTIGGSPRVKGSKLPPEQVAEIVNKSHK